MCFIHKNLETMVEIRVIFGDDRENEEFLGFDLDNIEEAVWSAIEWSKQTSWILINKNKPIRRLLLSLRTRYFYRLFLGVQ
jgi:hypothetical protein